MIRNCGAARRAAGFAECESADARPPLRGGHAGLRCAVSQGAAHPAGDRTAPHAGASLRVAPAVARVTPFRVITRASD